jgi:hypothetical protein
MQREAALTSFGLSCLTPGENQVINLILGGDRLLLGLNDR